MIQDLGTILIVDDEPFARETLRVLLADLGYAIQLAVSGPEALAMAETHAPDLVLLDVMMPEMNGFQVCEQIRRDPKLADIPVLMVTALDDRASRLRGIEAGADDFIAKPFDRLELRTRVKTILRLNRYRHIQTERTKFEWVVEQAEQGYVILDETDHIQYMNAKARLLLGQEGQTAQTGQDQLGDLPTFTELANRQYIRKPIAAWENWPNLDASDASGASGSGQPTPTERFLVRPETAAAPPFWLSVTTMALPQGSSAGFLVRLQNVSDQVGMVREQRTFHGLIQHRLRTPVTLMLGSLDIVSHEVAEDPDLSGLVEIAQRGAQRIHEDIEEILAYLKAPSVMMVERGMRLMDLPNLVDTCAQRLGLRPIPTYLPTNVRPTEPADVRPTEPADVRPTEPADVRIVMSSRFAGLILLELLQNARKFHPNHAPAVQVTVSPPDDCGLVHIFVRDDGIHLSPDQLAQVWHPYFQAEKGFSGEMEGWGLGLSTVASLVWGVGGSCRLGNRSDHVGVEVELILPTIA